MKTTLNFQLTSSSSRPHLELGAHRRAAVAVELGVLPFEVLREDGELFRALTAE